MLKQLPEALFDHNYYLQWMANLLYLNYFYQVNLFYSNFSKKSSLITLLDWPGNSPDLNSIENERAALKKEICKDKIITNERDLIENIIKAWHNAPAHQDIAKKCNARMPKLI